MTYVNEGSVTGIGIFFAVLSVLLVAGRFESRRRWMNRLEADDWLALAGATVVIGIGIAMAVGAQQGVIGSHSPEQQSAQLLSSNIQKQISLEKYEFGLLLCHQIAITLVKLSILFFYRRVFRGRGHRTAFDIVNWVLIGLQLAYGIAFFLSTLFACGRNVEAFWGSLADLKTKCIDTFWQNTVSSIINFVMDLAVFVVPIVMVSTLNMPQRQKKYSTLVFLAGAFAVGAGCTRMVVWIKIATYDLLSGGPLLGLPSGNDDIGVVSILLFWNYMEVGVGIFVACLPAHIKYIDALHARYGALLSQVFSLRSFSRRTDGSAGDEEDAMSVPRGRLVGGPASAPRAEMRDLQGFKNTKGPGDIKGSRDNKDGRSVQDIKEAQAYLAAIGRGDLERSVHISGGESVPLGTFRGTGRGTGEDQVNVATEIEVRYSNRYSA